MINLPKIKTKNKKRLGKGYGSGKGGHTSSRGQKGQKARYKVGIMFEGTKVKKSFMKRLPLKRGKGKFKSRKAKPIVVNLDLLNVFSAGAEVDLKSIVKQGLVREADANEFGVKILGGGELNKKLTVKLPASKSAIQKIEKAGGSVIDELNENEAKTKKTAKPKGKKLA